MHQEAVTATPCAAGSPRLHDVTQRPRLNRLISNHLHVQEDVQNELYSLNTSGGSKSKVQQDLMTAPLTAS
jgi:hypothetical protein